jgi:hypothetical protein
VTDGITDDERWEDALLGLARGDFSRLEPLFVGDIGQPLLQPWIVAWHEQGRFTDERQAVSDVLTCACFLGYVDVAEYLLERGVKLPGGSGTGVDALHWAVNRGQLETVRLLLRWRAPLETVNMHGATALGMAIWSAIHEPRSQHLVIAEELLRAGARRDAVTRPTGHAALDELLGRISAP